tara:strand:+ start:15652 stop:18522 length:2871 start_codon:yes stop_codon:yes gene_type:complete
MSHKKIIIKGAKEHNLKNIDVSIPHNALSVITGLSGSGKSSLAFDTIYAEGQRRYVESLSAYARQFLGLMEKPNVESIEGLSPAISIDQKGVSKNPRSTVATVTEIYDYLRLLFARIGTPFCPNCNVPIEKLSKQEILEQLIQKQAGTKGSILAPLITHKRGEHKQLLLDIKKSGFIRVRVNKEIREIDEEIILDRYKWHDIEIVVDRVQVPSSKSKNKESIIRISDSLEQALKLGQGTMIYLESNGAETLYSENYACNLCLESLYSVPQIEPRNFSFNSPHGACNACSGLGKQMILEPSLLIPDKNLSIAEGGVKGIRGIKMVRGYMQQRINAVGNQFGFSVNEPLKSLSKNNFEILLYGEPNTRVEITYRRRGGSTRSYSFIWEGVIAHLERRYKEAEGDRDLLEKFMIGRQCKDCNGKRLKKEALSIKIDDKNIGEVSQMSVADASAWIQLLQKEGTLSKTQREISKQIILELEHRLSFLNNVGLDYLTLNRESATLAGGESQRIRLATQIGSALTGVLYVCDEPSIGLHSADSEKLIKTLKKLRDLGNTVVVVEHDESMIRTADYIVDLGPKAGEHGGEIVACGKPEQIAKKNKSITGQYLSGKRSIPMPKERRNGNDKSIIINGAKENNLKNINVEIPLGSFVCVTGVSGSGKSTLINEILAKALWQKFYKTNDSIGKHDQILGSEFINKVIRIDQSPIGRTPRSNPATYTGMFTAIREMFASLPEANLRGYKPGRFSFNVKGGRCEPCAGDGYVLIEMQFLPDISIPCEICKGKRYNEEALEIEFNGKNIAEVLQMTVSEALIFFEAFPRVKKKLQTLNDVGLGYIRLGQPATTVSGGEAQRIKLATELSKNAKGHTLYLLDEPTTGLALEDINALLKVLQELVSQGNTVLIIEHHLDVIKNADWVIDLGPVGGEKGGYLIACGTPEKIAKTKKSITGQYLKQLFKEKRK